MSKTSQSARTSLTSASVITIHTHPESSSGALRIQSVSSTESTVLSARAHNSSGPEIDGGGDRIVEAVSRSPSTSAGLMYRDSPQGSPSRFRQPSAGSRLDEYRPGRVSGSRLRTGSSASTNNAGASGMPKLKMPMTIDTNARTHIRSPLSPPVMSLPNVGRSSTPVAAGADSHDYFGLGIAVSRNGTPQTGDASPISPTARTRRQRDDTGSPTTERRRSRTSNRREKDKKAMLSMALEKANTAVLLDNAMNPASALDAYSDACRLLEQVMERTSGTEDKAKLEAIRNTYSTRIEELTLLQQPSSGEGSEKQLPPRPSSNESDLAAGAAAVPQLDALSSVSPFASVASPSGHNDLSLNTSLGLPMGDARDRTSFLTSVIREVEGPAGGGFLGPLWERERSRSPLEVMREGDISKERINSSDAPSPLEPNRGPSPKPPPKDELIVNGADKTPKQANGIEPASWLNTIDGSDSDQSRIMMSNSNAKHDRLSQHRPETFIEYDAVFDEAIEAAYDDNYDADNADEEQRMMDDIAKDYMDHSFKFDSHRKSSSPPGATTAPHSRNTWGSATIGNDRNAGDRALSLLSESSGLRGLNPISSDPRASTSTTSTSDGNQKIPATDDDTPTVGQDIFDADERRWTAGQDGGPVNTGTTIIPSRRRATSTASRKTDFSIRSMDVAPWEARDRAAEVTPWEVEDKMAEITPWEAQSGPGDLKPIKTGSLRRLDREPTSAASDSGSSNVGEISSPRARKVRTQRSGLSLRDQSGASTPVMNNERQHYSGGFGQTYARRNESSGHVSQRSITGTSTAASTTIGSSASVPPVPETAQQGGIYLFDTTLGRSIEQPMSSSPKSIREPTIPRPFEPCPDAALLRPFWMLRIISDATTHPRGAYLTTRLFMPHEAWLIRGVKLKNIEDKIYACDTLTIALTKLGGVDTYDADAVLEELQRFEEILERVQATLIKKLGSDVGPNNALREADKTVSSETPTDTSSAKDSAKGKGFSWRKLRGKASSVSSNGVNGGGEIVTMNTVPMTSFSGVEKRFAHRKQALNEAVFRGPQKDYMAAIAKLCEAVQVLDRIARQVEDPGLKHSSTTHVGLELSTRHASEFFAFYVCRFMLADMGALLDKYIKRGTEWVLA